MILNKEKYVAWFRIITLDLLFCLPLFTGGQNSEFNFATGNVTGKNYVGGLAGGISGNSVVLRNSYARGNVSGESRVGGLAGNGGGSVINCYSTGSVAGTTQTGGLIGYGNGTVTNSYWDTQTSGQLSSFGGTPRTTDPLTYPYAAGIYSGWDFTAVWKADIDPPRNNGYPYLSPSSVCLVSVHVYPFGAGTATGAGLCMANGQLQMEAVPSGSFVFRGWEKNGSVISVNSRFNLTVTENTSLVARFESKTTAVNENATRESSGLTVYPNPVTDRLWIDFPSGSSGIYTFQVLNRSGQLMGTFQAPVNWQRRYSFSVANLIPGVYLLVARHPEDCQTARFIKY